MSKYYWIPEEVGFGDRLFERLGDCTYAIVASAFFTYKAYKEIETALTKSLNNGAKIDFLIGRLGYVTEPKAIKGLLKLEEKYPRQLRILFDSDYSFHYKIAIFKSITREVIIIGSSNLTTKGFSSIGEINLDIIGNRNVFLEAKKLLKKRILVSKLAKEELNSYAEIYRNAEKYRRQRQTWDSKGQKIWRIKRQRFVQHKEPQEKKYVLCWIDYEEKDKTLKRNIASKYNETKRETGANFPNQWVHVSNRFGTHIKENELFVVFDDLTHTFGFAVCTKKFKILDSWDRKTTVIFYRFNKGWKLRLNKAGYDITSQNFGINDEDEIIKGTPLKSLIIYIQSMQSKQ